MACFLNDLGQKILNQFIFHDSIVQNQEKQNFVTYNTRLQESLSSAVDVLSSNLAYLGFELFTAA